MTAEEKADYVAALPPRVAHAAHALLVCAREEHTPATAAEVCVYDSHVEAFSARHTGAALREAQRRGLAINAFGVWVPTPWAHEVQLALEERALADEDEAG